MLNFAPKSSIDGVPIARLKAVLKSLHANRSDMTALRLSRKTYSECENAISIEILNALGAFDPETFELTDLGIALVGSASRTKIPRDKAIVMLSEFLTAVERHNAHTHRIHDITKVWIYGSYIKGATLVGDLDIALEVEKSIRLDNQLITKAEDEIYPIYFDDHYRNAFINRARKITRKILFPNGRPAEISLSFHTMVLVESAEPCSLYYTIEEGCIREPVVLLKHPDATVRADTMYDRSEYPDEADLLSRKLALAPMSPLWLAGPNYKWQGVNYRSFKHTRVKELYQLNSILSQRRLNRCEPVMQDFNQTDDAATPATRSNSFTLDTDSASFIIDRRITENGNDPIDYSISLEVRSMTGRRKSPHTEDTFAASYLAAALMAGDLNMISTRRSVSARIKIEAIVAAQDLRGEIIEFSRMASDHPALLMDDARAAV